MTDPENKETIQQTEQSTSKPSGVATSSAKSMETNIQAATFEYVEKLRADFNNKINAMNQENKDKELANKLANKEKELANKRELKALKQKIKKLSQKGTSIQSQMSSSTTDDMLSKMTQHSLRISSPLGKGNKVLSKIEAKTK